MQKIERIKNELNLVPTTSGVYIWKDAQQNVIYVGKAKNLRSRMRQYINLQDERSKIPLLVDQIESFDYIVTSNEHESLILENNLIKQHRPFFNTDFKDDKTYPFIAITTGDLFPSVKYTREKRQKNTRYFGPYTDTRAARELLEISRRVVPVCSATCPTWRSMNKKLQNISHEDYLNLGQKKCFNAHVGLSPGVCSGEISQEEYRKNIKQIEKFLSGHRREFITSLESNMLDCAKNLEFEQASRIKSRIEIIKNLEDKQIVVSSHNLNADVIGIFREETIAGVHVFVIREGCVINSNEFILDKGKNIPDQDLLHGFLLRYYDVSTSIPREVICEDIPEDSHAIELWLGEKLGSSHGAKVTITRPQKGEKNKLLRMAQKNARHSLLRYKVRTNYEVKVKNEALLQLESALALQAPPMRIECFDISTIHGSYTVASMVVFTNGRPDKSQYRRFKIRTPLDEANDFLSMQEVLSRRYAPKRLEDARFGKKPDLVILDGGKPQLSAAEAIFNKLEIDDISLCGLAKQDEEIYTTWQKSFPVILPNGSSSLYLVKQIRDEAHRFAISFHRELRGRGMTASILDEIPGLGPARKKALRKAFPSFTSLREASLNDIISANVVPEQLAKDIFATISQYNSLRDSNLANINVQFAPQQGGYHVQE